MPLHLIPRHLPPLSQMLPSLAATPAQLARALCLSERTIHRWIAADELPRPAALALYWVTPWGWSNVVSDAEFRVATAESLAGALGRENSTLQARVARLERTADFGSANGPTWHAQQAPQALR